MTRLFFSFFKWRVLILYGLNSHLERKSSGKEARDWTCAALRLIFTLERSAVGLWRVFPKHISSLEWQFSYKRLSKSWLNIYWRCQTQLFSVTYSVHAPPLDLVSSHDSARSFDFLPPPSPFGIVWKNIFKNAASLLLWRTSSCDARISKMSVSLCIATLAPCFTSLYPSELLPVMCPNQQFSHICPPLPGPPSVSLFTILCLLCPAAQSGGAKWQIQVRSGRRAASKHSFQLLVKRARMWNDISMNILTATPELLLVVGHFQMSYYACFLKTKWI